MADKVWFKIGEAARLVGATPKELRYWEKVIPELQPRRSKGNLRYYHQEDLVQLHRIRQWLTEGCTVSDCRELLLGSFTGFPKSQTPLEPGNGRKLEAALNALRTLHARLVVPLDEALPPDGKPKNPPRRSRKSPSPAAGALFLDVEAEIEIPEAVAVPKRVPKPKPEEESQSPMWSGGQLPLECEE